MTLAPILILRDPRESVRKCSLTPLRGTLGVRFLEYAPDRRFQAPEHILLHTDGELITAADRGRPLLLLDCAWRRVGELLSRVDGPLVPRRLPPLKTAYPRRSRVFQDPFGGLASIEALYAALYLLGDVRPDLLANYRFRDEFLAANPELSS